ncbi:uncharacterized protein K452DRAFT_285457 [Aplosporella prunicola CBS 121167]|uniref:Uncharacterized protein n=1 Tax=Aplosporella prunicola CBS 121167 TaxID=1176127 RepID=A0A6A6BJ68_9PEZI|nr:uncharacterized protein K452DRAFT_285457 [Aplosporella prunicola CBS 121167]KAF2144210.1 hypothetical protein K452DRAFT_285457 [Aplosporella prunicola CBS 121167]
MAAVQDAGLERVVDGPEMEQEREVLVVQEKELEQKYEEKREDAHDAEEREEEQEKHNHDHDHTEEETDSDVIWRSRTTRAGMPALLQPMFDKGDKVYFCPKGNRRAKQGPFRVVTSKAGNTGGVYTLETPKGPMHNIVETELIQA